MQRGIDELKKKLRCAWQRRSSLGSESSFEDAEDATYRQRSRTPPSKTFSGDEEYSSHRHKNKSPSRKGLGNKAMNEALNQVAKSPFTRRINLISRPSLFIMVEQIRWSMLAILIKKWPFILKMRP